MSYNPTNWQNLPTTTTPVIAEKLNNVETGIKENDSAIGKDTYDNTQTYAVGDFCIYNNALYRCKIAVTTAESFDNSKWEQTSILNEMSLKNNYSTTEKVVGTWIDGKPLYAKTYNTYTTDTSGSDVIYFFENGTNFAKGIDIKKYDYSVKIQYLATANYLNAYNGENGALGTFYFGDNITGGNVYIGRNNFNSYYNVIGIEATIYYTKSSD